MESRPWSASNSMFIMPWAHILQPLKRQVLAQEDEINLLRLYFIIFLSFIPATGPNEPPFFLSLNIAIHVTGSLQLSRFGYMVYVRAK